MARPSYTTAIEWVASNDDCYWLGDYDNHGPILSVTAAMVRDLWDVSDDKLIYDLRKALARAYPDHPALH